jgi:hypothetical protein
VSVGAAEDLSFERRLILDYKNASVDQLKERQKALEDELETIYYWLEQRGG